MISDFALSSIIWLVVTLADIGWSPVVFFAEIVSLFLFHNMLINRSK